ncbi:MFS transporter [Roseomonas elaeocarpi]|uniref:MFS transporter n=1 Tax=Roseomonas elaeocarpi TaxID=907779 RepID=A0ABV6JNF7_9PROT
MTSCTGSAAQSAASNWGLPLHAVVLGAFFGASAAPTPLYRIYQETFALSPLLTTAIFAVYALALLKALLVAGSISDHLGRRPVIFVALLMEIASMGLFVAADGAGWLIAARLVQGLATGVAASSLGAALVDIDRGRGQLVNSLAPLLGMAFGASGAAALVQYGPHPLHLAYAILGLAFAVLAGALWLTPETGGWKPGVMRSLRPRILIPQQVRRSLLAITATNVAGWMVGGFYLSLVPSLVVAATGSRAPMTGGMVVTVLMLAGAAAVLARRTKPAMSNLTIGTFAMVAGILVVLAGMHGGSVPVMVGGTLLGGLGFGACFLGSVGCVMPLAKPDERAGLLAAFYVQSYLAFSLPAVLAGYLVLTLGYTVTADAYAAVIVAMCLAGLVTRRILMRRDAR